MDAGRGHEAGQSLEELDGGEDEDRPPVGGRAREPVDESGLRRGERVMTGWGLKTVQCERGPGTVAHQPLDALTIVALDANRRVDAEAARFPAT